MKWMVAPAGLMVAVAALGAQQAQDAGALADELQLHGRVVDGRDGAALPRARLVVRAGDRHLLPVFTDDRGRFVVTVPPADGYLVRVSKARYAPDIVPLAAGARGREMTVALSRGAALEGRVLDATGAPLVDVTVAARRQVPSDAPAAMSPFVTETDDRGDFRLGGLPAGRYEVRVLGFDAPISFVWNDVARQRTAGFVERAFSEAPDAGTPSFLVHLEPGDELVGRDLIVHAAPAAACQTTRAAPANPAGTSAIRGRITAAGGGPLACARVRLLGQGSGVRTAVTDADGRYLIEHLAAGSYTLGARHPGYVTLQYGQQPVGDAGTMLTLGPDEVLDRIDVALPRGSAIFGTVVDERGEPLAGVSVRALELRALDGRVVASAASGVRSERQTDDRGRYRLVGLLPGSYLVTASADADVPGTDAAPGHGYAPVYFPGTTEALGALPVHLDVGRDAAADLVFVATPTARVTGLALDEEGRPTRGDVLLSVRYRSGAPILEPRQTQAGPDGSFIFTNVPAGDYVVQVIAAGRAGPPPAGVPLPGAPAPTGPRPLRLFGMQYVTVTDPVPPPVTIRMTVGATLEGRVSVEESAAAARLALLAVPTDRDRSPIIESSGPPGFAGFAFRDDGSFSYPGLHGPQRITLRAAPDGHYVKSVIVDGQDVTDRPFDFGAAAAVVHADAAVVVSRQGAAIEGHATNERGDRVGHNGVVVFPVDRTLWFRTSRHLKFARADQDGTFQVSGLPPGRYLVAAVDRIGGTLGTGEWQEPALLDQLVAQARPITLMEGEWMRTTVRLIRR